MKTCISILFLFLATSPSNATAQDLAFSLSPDTHLKITAYGESDRFIWVGTNEGLYRINKKNGTKSQFTQKTSALPHNYITSIACASTGQTYIGTIYGLFVWDSGTFQTITTDNSNIPDNRITALAMDRDDHLWIGTYGEGLVKSTGDPIKPFRCQPIEFNNEKIYSITIDPSGNVWVTFFNGRISCLKNGEWHTYGSHQPIKNIPPGGAGIFLLNTPDKGTIQYKDFSFKPNFKELPCGEKTCEYYNPSYSRFFFCYEDEVYVLNCNQPYDPPVLLSVSSFFDSLCLKYGGQKKTSSTDRLENL